MVKHRLCWVLCLGIAGCGGAAPAAPSPGAPGLPGRTVPQFSTGLYQVSMSGPLFADPLVPGCPGWVTGPPSTSVTLWLTVVKEGAEWVGRPANSAADIELRFRDAEDAGELAFGRRVLTGTIRGQAPDMTLFPELLSPRDSICHGRRNGWRDRGAVGGADRRLVLCQDAGGQGRRHFSISRLCRQCRHVPGGIGADGHHGLRTARSIRPQNISAALHRSVFRLLRHAPGRRRTPNPATFVSYTSGLRVVRNENREKSRSALHNSATPCCRHSAAMRASWV